MSTWIWKDFIYIFYVYWLFYCFYSYGSVYVEASILSMLYFLTILSIFWCSSFNFLFSLLRIFLSSYIFKIRSSCYSTACLRACSDCILTNKNLNIVIIINNHKINTIIHYLFILFVIHFVDVKKSQQYENVTNLIK